MSQVTAVRTPRRRDPTVSQMAHEAEGVDSGQDGGETPQVVMGLGDWDSSRTWLMLGVVGACARGAPRLA